MSKEDYFFDKNDLFHKSNNNEFEYEYSTTLINNSFDNLTTTSKQASKNTKWELLNIFENNKQTNLYCDFTKKFPFDEKELRIKNLPFSFPNTPDIYDIFNLLWGEDLWDLITEQTNLFICQFFKNPTNKHKNYFKNLNKFTKTDIKKFHGLILWSGLLSNIEIEDNWSNDFIFETNFKKIMPFYKFSLIKKFLHLNDNSCDTKEDKLFKVRKIIDYISNSFLKYYECGKDLAIDETLIKFHGRLSFSQNLRNKPNKRGIKAYLICDSHNFYCYKFIIYAGSESMKKIFQPFIEKNNYYNFNKIELISLYLLDNFLDQSRIVFMDNYYTTIKLAEFLVNHKTGIVGTMRKNRVKIDKKKFPIPEKRTECLFLINSEKTLTLTIFYDSILVYLLSSIEIPQIAIPKPGLYRTRPIYGKPTCIHKYNRGAQGVDHCNHRCAIYRYPHHNYKWWKPCYYHLFQLVISNAWVIYKEFFMKLNYNGKMHMCKKYKDFYKGVLEGLILFKDNVKNNNEMFDYKNICNNNNESSTYDDEDDENFCMKLNLKDNKKYKCNNFENKEFYFIDKIKNDFKENSENDLNTSFTSSDDDEIDIKNDIKKVKKIILENERKKLENLKKKVQYLNNLKMNKNNNLKIIKCKF